MKGPGEMLINIMAYSFTVAIVYLFCCMVMWTGYGLGMPVNPSVQNVTLFFVGYLVTSMGVNHLAKAMDLNRGEIGK